MSNKKIPVEVATHVRDTIDKFVDAIQKDLKSGLAKPKLVWQQGTPKEPGLYLWRPRLGHGSAAIGLTEIKGTESFDHALNAWYAGPLELPEQPQPPAVEKTLVANWLCPECAYSNMSTPATQQATCDDCEVLVQLL